MPVKLKELANDQHHALPLGEQVDEVMQQLTEANNGNVVEFHDPKEYIARTKHEELRTKRIQQKVWLETIIQRNNALQMSRLKVQEMASRAREGFAAPLVGSFNPGSNRSSGGGHGM